MIVPPRGRSPQISRDVSAVSVVLDEPAPAVVDADDLVAAAERPPRDRADDRVQPGAVAAAGEDADALHHRLSLRSAGECGGWDSNPHVPKDELALRPPRLPIPPPPRAHGLYDSHLRHSSPTHS